MTLNRWLVAILAAACFVAAGCIAVASPKDQFWWGGFLRGGVVLVALWFCLPTKSKPAAWAGISPLSATLFAAAVLLTILRPRFGLPLLLVLLALRAIGRWFRRK